MVNNAKEERSRELGQGVPEWDVGHSLKGKAGDSSASWFKGCE